VSAVAPASLGHAPRPSSDATRLLYERHSGRIFGFCLSLLGSREDAEDAVQTTFVNAQRGLHRGVVPQFELAWLFKIARNVCHNSRQSASRRGRVEAVRDLDALQDVLATPERGGSVSIRDLTRALNAVPERQRRALVLREWQGLSYEEIAAELGVSIAAVETLLFRARRSVAQQLEQGGTRRGDLVASVVAFFQWLFKGGAALKLGAAAVTVATATMLAAAPTVRDPARTPTPVPVAPKAHTVRSQPIRIEPRSALGRAPVQQAASSSTTATAGGADAASPPASSSSGATPLSGGTPSGTNVAPTAISVPSVTVPVVTTPTVTVPEISLPPVDVPAIVLPAELPLDLPKFP
jgi:RNA polymerase sigma-70 factor (ECF subfamily)